MVQLCLLEEQASHLPDSNKTCGSSAKSPPGWGALPSPPSITLLTPLNLRCFFTRWESFLASTQEPRGKALVPGRVKPKQPSPKEHFSLLAWLFESRQAETHRERTGFKYSSFEGSHLKQKHSCNRNVHGFFYQALGSIRMAPNPDWCKSGYALLYAKSYPAKHYPLSLAKLYSWKLQSKEI